MKVIHAYLLDNSRLTFFTLSNILIDDDEDEAQHEHQHENDPHNAKERRRTF